MSAPNCHRFRHAGDARRHSHCTTLIASALFGATLLPSPALAQKNSAAYRAAVPADAQSDDGLFTVQRAGGRLKFEILDSVLDWDMIAMSRYAHGGYRVADGSNRMRPTLSCAECATTTGSAYARSRARRRPPIRAAPAEEDPEFSLLDARYSVVCYVATTVRGANSGGEVEGLVAAMLRPPARSWNDAPSVNAHLQVGQSDIRRLIRNQLTLLDQEIAAVLARGVRDRMTRIRLEDARVRIAEALNGSGRPAPAPTGGRGRR